MILIATVILVVLQQCLCHDVAQDGGGKGNSDIAERLLKEKMLMEELQKLCKDGAPGCIEEQKEKLGKRGTEDWWFQYFQKQFNKYPTAGAGGSIPISLGETIVNMGGKMNNDGEAAAPRPGRFGSFGGGGGDGQFGQVANTVVPKLLMHLLAMPTEPNRQQSTRRPQQGLLILPGVHRQQQQQQQQQQ